MRSLFSICRYYSNVTKLVLRHLDLQAEVDVLYGLMHHASAQYVNVCLRKSGLQYWEV